MDRKCHFDTTATAHVLQNCVFLFWLPRRVHNCCKLGRTESKRVSLKSDWNQRQTVNMVNIANHKISLTNAVCI